MDRWIAVKVWASLCDLSEHNDSRSSSPPDTEPELTLSGSSYAYNELLTNVFIFWSSGGTFCNSKPTFLSSCFCHNPTTETSEPDLSNSHQYKL